MITEIDQFNSNYQAWALEGLNLKDGLLSLLLVSYRDDDEPIRFHVVFTDAQLIEVYDECYHFENFHEHREAGIVSSYLDSSFLEHVKNSTNITSINRDNLSHWSVMSTNEVVHVITSQEPKIVNVT